MKQITVEEHCLAKCFMGYLRPNSKYTMLEKTRSGKRLFARNLDPIPTRVLCFV